MIENAKENLRNYGTDNLHMDRFKPYRPLFTSLIVFKYVTYNEVALRVRGRNQDLNKLLRG